MLSRNIERIDPLLPASSKDDKVLPGDIVEVCSGPHVGKKGTIEWFNSDGKVWVSLTNHVGEGGVELMDTGDLYTQPALHTITFSKEKGYNVAVGDTVEVARGKWYRCQGIVKAVDLVTAHLVMCSVDGIQVSNVSLFLL